MISMICKMALLATLKYYGTEADGTNNYLFSASHVSAKCTDGGAEVKIHGPLDLTYSSKEPLQVSVGEATEILAAGDCLMVWGIDEGATARSNAWHSFKKWLCTADKLKIIK